MAVDLTPYKIVVLNYPDEKHPGLDYQAEVRLKNDRSSARRLFFGYRAATPEDAVEGARAAAIRRLEQDAESDARLKAWSEAPVVLEVDA